MKVNAVSIRGIQFGQGEPKICVPIVEKTEEDILESARKIVAGRPDCVEFRADWFEHCLQTNVVCGLLPKLRNILGDTVLLFTFRSKAEGGEQEIAIEQYEQLCEAVCSSGYVDLIDLEAYMEPGMLKRVSELAHRNNVYVVASNHDFAGTPSEQEILERLQYMDAMGADFPKIAVMPLNERDVLNLLSATVAYREQGGCKPIITMAMKGLGGITRLSGEIFGSAVTFAAVDNVSAPGQYPLSQVRDVLGMIHESL